MRIKRIIPGFLVGLIIFSTFGLSLINSGAAKTDEDFDPGLQLKTYLSFGAEIVDYKIGFLDADDNLDLAVAHEDAIFIYEDAGKGFEEVWSIITGDSNFISDSSNITTLAIADVIGRSDHINEIDNITTVDNSSNCIIIDPLPDNISYLWYADALFYNMNFTAGGMGNFSFNLKIHYGLSLTSFQLFLRMKDTLITPLPESQAWLLIYNNGEAQWEQYYELTSAVGTIYNDIYVDSSILSDPVSSYLDSNNELKFSIRYNHTTEITLKIDEINLTDITVDSSNDLVVGGGNGELNIIQCIDAADNTYKAAKAIDSTEYGNTGFPIRSMEVADINSDEKDEIIVGAQNGFVYPIQSNKEASNDFDLFVPVINTGTDSSVSSLSGSFFGVEFVLAIGTKSGSYFITKYTNVVGDFNSSLTGIDVEYPINSLKIGDINDDGNYEVIVGCTDKNIRIYDASNNEELKEKLGDNIISVAFGDFLEKNKPLVVFGTGLEKSKIQILDPENDYEVVWTSTHRSECDLCEYNFIREEIIDVESLSESEEDTLIIATFRHILFLTISSDDEDDDKLSDLSETNFYSTYPDMADSDEDGLEDGVEIYVYGTNPMKADTDGDLVPDGLEIQLGTDPLDPASSIIIIILIPTLIGITAIAIFIVVRKSVRQKRAEYNRVKVTPNLMPQVQRLIIQRLETYMKEFKGFKSKTEMEKFKRNLKTEMISIVLDRLYNFLEYIRLKGILFTDREEKILKTIVGKTLKPVEVKTETLLTNLLMYETKYTQFNEQFLKLLEGYADWKRPAQKGTKIIEELIKCPKCGMLGPKGSAFCLECGNKLVKESEKLLKEKEPEKAEKK